MSKPRLIACLLLKNGLIVRSQLFKMHQDIGNPMSTVERFSHWNVDELVILDISQNDFHDLRRDDLYASYDGSTALDVLHAVSEVCFMPLTFGGRIRTMEDVRLRLAAGADKVVLNSQAVDTPDFITRIAEHHGSQCVVVSIDAKRHADGHYEAYSHCGTRPMGMTPAFWAREAERLGAGEIFLNSIDRDGSALGYDIELIRSVTAVTGIPVIACGGVGRYEDLSAGITHGGASAVAAANIFHFFELSYPQAKKACLDAGLNMRPVLLGGKWISREPGYEPGAGVKRVATRIAMSHSDEPLPPKPSTVRWCAKCVYPSISAAPMEFDELGVCMGCRMAEMKKAIRPDEWSRRRKILREILEKYRSRNGNRYDCVIAVSGGKDSYYQAHVIKNEFRLNPLLVTYNGNNYTPVGWRNVHRMKEVFDADHIFFSPGVKLLRTLNRLAFHIMGDMNWHAHVGITTVPVRAAVEAKTPLVIWGEHGYLDLCGQFSMNDFPEMSYRDRLEHFARGFEWNYFVGLEGIESNRMIPYKYPTDQELFDLDVRGIYIGNYVWWEANDHSKLVVEKYGFEVNAEPFDRTYRLMSNLDDMHENGVHDYLKYVKFGYGRCTDHVCKDIRAGLMSRDEGIALVRRYDHVKPRDLTRWLEYTGMSEEAFDRVADTFRDPRVWRKEDGVWIKSNLWD